MAKYQPFEADWRIHASVNQTTIGSDNGLSSDRRQAIIRTNAGTLLIALVGTHFKWNLYQNTTVAIQENAFKNGICKTVAIFLVGGLINSHEARGVIKALYSGE